LLLEHTSAAAMYADADSRRPYDSRIRLLYLIPAEGRRREQAGALHIWPELPKHGVGVTRVGPVNQSYARSATPE